MKTAGHNPAVFVFYNQQIIINIRNISKRIFTPHVRFASKITYISIEGHDFELMPEKPPMMNSKK